MDKIQFGDLILADTIAEELAVRGALLEIPAFMKGKQQLHKKKWIGQGRLLMLEYMWNEFLVDYESLTL